MSSLSTDGDQLAIPLGEIRFLRSRSLLEESAVGLQCRVRERMCWLCTTVHLLCVRGRSHALISRSPSFPARALPLPLSRSSLSPPPATLRALLWVREELLYLVALELPPNFCQSSPLLKGGHASRARAGITGGSS